jgi:hypothetical protein
VSTTRRVVVGLALLAGIMLPLAGCGEAGVEQGTPSNSSALPTPDDSMMKGAPRPK